MSPKCNYNGPYKKKTDTHRRVGGNVAMEPKIEVMWPLPRNAGSHRKLKQVRKGFPTNPQSL